MDVILEIWEGALKILGAMPAWMAGALVGWVGSLAFTQTFKYMMPRSVDHDLRSTTTRLVAVLAGTAVCAVYLFELSPYTPRIVWLTSFCAGFMSPISYTLFVAIVKLRYPKMAEALSSEVRGRLTALPEKMIQKMKG